MCRYKTSDDCPSKKQVVIGRCEGNQIYDTSMCIDCNAQCVGAEDDPQKRGQFIERECSTGSNDYVCRPCSDRCPINTFIFSKCTGTGRTDTGCSICTHFCREAQLGVPGAHGQYISGRCDGSQRSDVQVGIFTQKSTSESDSRHRQRMMLEPVFFVLGITMFLVVWFVLVCVICWFVHPELMGCQVM